ncbi:hypothetical protein M011DRAFT_497822 [Sporormia fimetaria CBS 119925]|uniref:C2H2-type domain-containing protein n=1 Tax=Sporormia fimetaria CBS 119925 TaxID=1340428 RepID=A0A6A6UVS5_9PLEO|nr:hypothetical protein M011DRAFT_497822 [Sporormia fimetaria CBS 119925]
MADSDYAMEDSGSDDEYIGPKSTNTTSRASTTGKKNAQSKGNPRQPQAPQAWQRRGSEPTIDYEEMILEAEEAAVIQDLQQSVQEKEEERKRKRLRKDTKPFQRGIIRHVVLVLDLSETMLEKDMRPNRFIAMINYTQEYVREFFEQNPISQMSVLGMHDGLCIREIVSRTNAGAESEYVIATDQELLRELLLATTTPPVVRKEGDVQAESTAALMMMGFPSRVVESIPTLCACHGILTRSGYTCSRCAAKVCSLPVVCPCCGLTLSLSTHLARSYHHLFPLRNWTEVSWQRAREKGSQECAGCLAPFPTPPLVTVNGEKDNAMEGVETNGVSVQAPQDEDEADEQRASESSRYECRSCQNHFCIDCDSYCHMVLHNCPGCLSGDAGARLIRFVANDGKAYYGNLTKDMPVQAIEGSSVEVLDGDITQGWKKNGVSATVSKLLCPLPSTPIILCVGLNYRRHAEECNLQIPTYPTIFTKPADALAGPLEPIPIHPTCQSQLDYEGELTFIFSRDAKNVPAKNYRDYILGYTTGNDVSARNYQLPASVSGGQFSYAKSFDKFAPIGAYITNKELVKEEKELRLSTKVDGGVRQETGCDDMIWSVGSIVEHLTRGTTVRRGTVVMTGTPSGVGFFMEPKGFLGDGAVVEVNVEGLGGTRNRMVFEKEGEVE